MSKEQTIRFKKFDPIPPPMAEIYQEKQEKIINYLIAKRETPNCTWYLEYSLTKKEIIIEKHFHVNNTAKGGHFNTKNTFFIVEEPGTRRAISVILNGKTFAVQNPRHPLKYG